MFLTNALSEESHIIKIIEKEWNRTQTLNGKFHQKIDGDKVISGNFFIEKPYKSNFTYHNQTQNVITSKYFINFVDKKGKGSPPFDHLTLKDGDKLTGNDFPLVYKS